MYSRELEVGLIEIQPQIQLVQKVGQILVTLHVHHVVHVHKPLHFLRRVQPRDPVPEPPEGTLFILARRLRHVGKLALLGVGLCWKGREFQLFAETDVGLVEELLDFFVDFE